MPAIRAIETAVPSTIVHQDAFRDTLRSQPAYGALGRRLVTAAFDGSAIETRRTVVEEFGSDGGRRVPAVFVDDEGLLADPRTAARNDLYALHATPLLADAARRALGAAPGVEAADVTHVITVSCTGFFAPGPDFALVRDLGLAPGTQRYHLGFMGCYAVLPALRMAAQFCAADPGAVVLVASVELCSLHLHVDPDPDAIVAASVFADGAAAAIVTADPGPGDALVLDGFESTILPEGASAMAWTVGDHGFDMVLSSYVPRLVGSAIGSALAPLLARGGVSVDDVGLWAVHPGGRSILDRVEAALALAPEQFEPSRRVLRDYGNMSSATILFVLRELLSTATATERQELALARTTAIVAPPEAAGVRAPTVELTGRAGAPQRVAAMAFGPGLTVETALLTLRPAPSASPC